MTHILFNVEHTHVDRRRHDRPGGSKVGGRGRHRAQPASRRLDKVSGIVLIAAVAGSASLPSNVKPALLAIAALSGAWALWKIHPVLKAVQAQVQAESTTPASNESGFDPFDPSTAQFIGTVSAGPAAPATTSLQHHQHHRKPTQPRRTPSRHCCSCTAYTSLPPPSISKQPAATFGASAGTRHMRAGACICSFA